MRTIPGAVCAAIVCVAALCPRRAHAETVAVLVASRESEPAARYLLMQLDVPAVRRSSWNARNLDALIQEARAAAWHDDLIVVMDAQRAVVSVVRPSDGTIGSRTLAAQAAKAPYAVALAAVELLEIVRNAPPARAGALPATPEKPQRLTLEVGVLQSVGSSGDIGLLQPTAGLDLDLWWPRDPLWVSAGVHATGLVPMQRHEILYFPDGVDDRASVEYQRNEVSLRLVVGNQQGRAAVAGACDLGLAFVDATARDGAGQVVSSDAHTAFWLGLTGELSYSIGETFALGIGAGGAWFPVTTQFYASPPGSDARVFAFGEGALEFRARLAMHWGVGL